MHHRCIFSTARYFPSKPRDSIDTMPMLAVSYQHLCIMNTAGGSFVRRLMSAWQYQKSITPPRRSLQAQPLLAGNLRMAHMCTYPTTGYCTHLPSPYLPHTYIPTYLPTYLPTVHNRDILLQPCRLITSLVFIKSSSLVVATTLQNAACAENHGPLPYEDAQRG